MDNQELIEALKELQRALFIYNENLVNNGNKSGTTRSYATQSLQSLSSKNVGFNNVNSETILETKAKIEKMTKALQRLGDKNNELSRTIEKSEKESKRTPEEEKKLEENKHKFRRDTDTYNNLNKELENLKKLQEIQNKQVAANNKLEEKRHKYAAKHFKEDKKLHEQEQKEQQDRINFYREIRKEDEKYRKETTEHHKNIEKIKVGVRNTDEFIKKTQEVNKLEGENIEKYLKREELSKLLEKETKEKTKKKFGNGLRDDGKIKNFDFSRTLFSKAYEQNFGAHISGGGKAANVVSIAAGGFSKGLSALSSGSVGVSSMASALSGALTKMGPYGALISGFVEIFKQLYGEYARVDKAASDYARTVGGGEYAMKKMRKEAADLAWTISEFGGVAYDAEEVLNRLKDSSVALGRNLEHISTIDTKALVDLNRFGINDETIAQFDTFGVAVGNVSKEIASIYSGSGSKGLNAKAVINTFTSNLKLAQNYTFERGRKALIEMAEKSAQLKFNLRDAETFANKVSSLEGAMKAGAQLQVLGGSFAVNGNPLAMLYEGLNDMEGLQERMLRMTADMAKWDRGKNQFEITAFNRQRLRAMSEATGIDYSDLTSQAMNQARINRVESQLGFGIDKQTAEYIKNVASIDEKGNAYIRIGEKTYSIDDIRNDDALKGKLKSESESKKLAENANIGDIWKNTRSIQDKLDDIAKTLKTWVVSLLMQIARVSNDEQEAMRMGLSAKNAEAYDDLINRRNSADSERTLRSLGAKREDIKKAQKDDESWKKFVSETLLAQQDKGYEYKGNTSFKSYFGFESARGKTFENDWVKKANGGFITGNGGPTDDVIPAKLSNGEFVVNAESTKKHRNLLEEINNRKYADGGYVESSKNIDIRPIDNQSHYTNVNENHNINNSGQNINNSERISVEPIKISFDTLKLELNGITKDIDQNALANYLLNNGSFIDLIMQKISTRENFGYRKDMANNKFPTPVYQKKLF